MGSEHVRDSFHADVTRRRHTALRLHDLRHAFASMALSAGVDLKTVSSALGHSAISTTADIYAHVTDSLMRDAARRIDGALTVALRKSTKAS